MSLDAKNRSSRFPTRSDINGSVQSQKMVKSLKFRKKINFTIRVVKPKALISFAVTANLICAFVFAYAKFRFSHDAAHIIMCGWLHSGPLFLGRLRPERLTGNQIASQHRTSFHWRHNQPIYFLLGPQWVGAPVSV